MPCNVFAKTGKNVLKSVTCETGISRSGSNIEWTLSKLFTNAGFVKVGI